MKKIISNMDREEGRTEKVSLGEFAEKCELKIGIGDKNQSISFNTMSVNRPGLFVSGYDEYFASSRVQVIGNAEMYYLFKLDEETRLARFDALFSKNIPCVIISRGLSLTSEIRKSAKKHNIPVLLSSKVTSHVSNDIVSFLNELLAPSVSIHGVFLNINSMGVILTGDSSIGKSETALELIHRGHKLISDDNVIIKKIGRELVGTSPSITHSFMEIRGLGLIDIERIFGVGAIQEEKIVDMIIKLEPWDDNFSYDRLGKEIGTTKILGIDVPITTIPVTAGRNIALIIEVAAGNLHLRQAGYFAVEEIENRLSENKGKE